MSKTKKCFILAIDGGGVRGLIPLRALQYLEACLSNIVSSSASSSASRALVQYFDLVAGTSTGGIIAAGLCCPKTGVETQSAYQIDQLIELYKATGHDIFNERATEAELSGWLSYIMGRVTNGIFKSKHDAETLEGELKARLANKKISETLVDVILTAYDLAAREPVFITNMKDLVPGIYDVFTDYLFWEAARATSAAPIYLDPYISNRNDANQVLIDGGVFANDPTMIAYCHALRSGYDPGSIYTLSLGTGYHYLQQIYRDTDSWGAKEWLDPRRGIPLLSVLTEAPAKSTARLMQKMCPETYVRVDGNLGEKFTMDLADPVHMTKLDAAAGMIIRENEAKIRRFARLLVDNSEERASVLESHSSKLDAKTERRASTRQKSKARTESNKRR